MLLLLPLLLLLRMPTRTIDCYSYQHSSACKWQVHRRAGGLPRARRGVFHATQFSHDGSDLALTTKQIVSARATGATQHNAAHNES